jgi:hypothetical protein
MQLHTLTFNSFLDKHIAVDYVKEQIEPDTLDEKLTELQLVFLTGIDLPKRAVKRLLTEVPHTSYEAHDF